MAPYNEAETLTRQRTGEGKAKTKMVVVILYRGHRGYDFDPRLWWMQKCQKLHLDHKPKNTHEEINECYLKNYPHGLVKMDDLVERPQEKAI